MGKADNARGGAGGRVRGGERKSECETPRPAPPRAPGAPRVLYVSPHSTDCPHKRATPYLHSALRLLARRRQTTRTDPQSHRADPHIKSVSCRGPPRPARGARRERAHSLTLHARRSRRCRAPAELAKMQERNPKYHVCCLCSVRRRVDPSHMRRIYNI